MRSVGPYALASVLALLVLCSPTSAQEPSVDLSGSYRPSARDTRVEVTTWGQDCGPQPKNASEPGFGTVTVAQNGKHLVFTHGGRSFRTDACWSPNPMVRVVNSVATPTRFRTECRTPEGDAKKERGVYTVSAPTRDSIELLEESDYDWQLNQSHCVAKMRVTQRLERPSTIAAAAAEDPEPEPQITGCTPGALARLRLRPSEVRIGPGERTCFTLRGSDAAGCAVPLEGANTRWSLVKPGGADATLSGSCFKAASRAADAEGRFQVVVTSGALRVESTVSVVPVDLSDITARRGGGAAAAEEEELAGSTSDLGIGAVVRDSSEGVLIALAFGALALFVGLGWALYAYAFRRPAPVTPSRRPPRSSAAARSVSPALASAEPRELAFAGASLTGEATEQLICPQCRRGYPSGTERCPRDGERPIPYSEFLRQKQAAEQTATTCPACRAPLAPGALFCGACGTKARA